ncbi:amino acid ABC transporter permease [Thiomonas sp. FB-6]|uniref:amino acid ABC transporter permease n=1 Tax=Thiomonas sp. FB-6 TaxID=1158291 RepID=UPI00036630A9|nr:amino acid ABC transporter permease [Thiomonas sp. FB-6]
MNLDFVAVLRQWPLLASGLAWTVALTLLSTVFGMVAGILLGWARAARSPALRALTGVYVEAIRNTPFIVQLFFVFFGLPSLGLRLSPAQASVLAMAANLAGYSAEIVRAGIQSIPRGQLEAAASLALSTRQSFVHVVLPPALRRVWPALTGQIIIVMLGSAVCSQISTPELSYATYLIASRSFRSFEAYAIAAVAYLLLAIAVRQLLARIGKTLAFRS